MPEEVVEGQEVVVENKVEPKYFTKEELDAELARATKTARSMGYKDGKKEQIAPYLEKIRATPGFESAEDFDKAIDELLPLASERKRNARHDETRERELQGTKAERDAWQSKYKISLINNELQSLTSDMVNPKQAALLLQQNYRFDIDESDGEPKLIVLKANGERAMADDWRPLEPKDLVQRFKEENPHFVTSEEKVSLHTKNKGGLPNGTLSLEALGKIPIKNQTPEQYARWNKARIDGLLNPLTGELTEKGRLASGR